MTRSEIAHAIHTALREADLPLTLIAIRALPFAWELRFEDADGVERLLTVHQGSVASIEEAIRTALDPRNFVTC
jgi:hypothetical protein